MTKRIVTDYVYWKGCKVDTIDVSLIVTQSHGALPELEQQLNKALDGMSMHSDLALLCLYENKGLPALDPAIIGMFVETISKYFKAVAVIDKDLEFYEVVVAHEQNEAELKMGDVIPSDEISQP